MDMRRAEAATKIDRHEIDGLFNELQSNRNEREKKRERKR